MGSSLSSTANVANQIAINNVLQESRTTCLALCGQNVENINLAVTNGSYMGDIVISQECKADALCTIKTELETIALQELETIQFADSASQASPALITWPGFTISTAVNIVNQNLYNTITHTIDNTCAAVAQQSVKNINVLVSDNSEVGGFYINQTADVEANCTVENIAKVEATQSAKTDQTSVAKAGSILVLLAVIVAVIILVIGTLYLNNRLKIETINKKYEAYQAALNSQNPNAANNLLRVVQGLAVPSGYPPPLPPSPAGIPPAAPTLAVPELNSAIFGVIS